MLIRWPWRLFHQGRLPTPERHWGREHFIPMTPGELVSRIGALEAAEGRDAADFGKLGDQIIELIHRQYRPHQIQLVSLYHGFDPDRDAPFVSPDEVQPETNDSFDTIDREDTSRKLFSEISDSLHFANYRRLKPTEILEALKAASHWGVRLKIRFSSFRRLEVYGRGDIVAKRWRRELHRFYRLREVDVPIYQRLVVVFRTKQTQILSELLAPEFIHVRMFKNIPKADVDMMLPGTQVRLNWMDTGKIGLPTAWGMSMLASKIAKSVWLLAWLSAAKAISSVLFLIAILVATSIYGVKSLFSYTTAKRRYQLSIAKNLYYQNLDNNLGALLRLIDEAEQQEACEAIVGYFVLARSDLSGLDSNEIDRKAEILLKKLTGVDIDFDVDDALRDLARMRICELTSQGWTALSVERAIEETSLGAKP